MKAITEEKPPTAGQMKQVRRFLEDHAATLGDWILNNLNRDQTQNFLKKGGKFSDLTFGFVQELSVGNLYVDEEIASVYGYSSGYKPIKRDTPFEEVMSDLSRQAAILSSLLGIKVSFDVEWARREWKNLPEGAEKLFLIPRWEKIASTYGEAVEKVFEIFKKNHNCKFENCREGQLGPQYLSQSQKSAKALQKLGAKQKDYDMLVVPAQFGLRHRGRSVRRAREVMNSSEFGLGAFAIGIMLLTHPERLQYHDDLGIDCAGDEYAPAAGDSFSYTSCFRFTDSRVKFGIYYVGSVSGKCGATSGFLQQKARSLSLER